MTKRSASITSASLSAQQLFEEAASPPSHTDRSARCVCQHIRYRWVTIGMLAIGMIIIHAQRVNLAVSLLTVSNNDAVVKDDASHNSAVPVSII